MAIKISNTTVIDNSKNFSIADISFADATSQTTAGGSGGEVGSILKHSKWSLIYTLDNPNAYSTGTTDYFGKSLAISGNYIIVGAYQEDDPNGSNSGKAYIFDLITGSLIHTLDNPTAYSTGVGDTFGIVSDISGNYAIVGVPLEDDPSGAGSNAGKAYIFDVTTGSLIHTLENPNAYSTSFGDNFGIAVGISGNYAIVAAQYEDDAGGTSSGKAYIFDVPTGSLVHTLDNPNAYSTSTYDYFGASVAISGNYAIVGAFVEDDAGGSGSGKAYIFDVTTGTLIHTLDNPTAYSTSAYDNFGEAVGISASYAIVGAKSEDDPGGNAGKAYIFDVATGVLLHTLDNPNAYSTSAGDYFGYSVSISDTHAIVGATLEDDGGGESGTAYVFDVITGSLLRTLDNPNAYGAPASDSFGKPIAISGNYAAIAALGEDSLGASNSGKVYVYAIADIYELNSIEKITFSNGFELSQDHPLLQKTTRQSWKNVALSTVLNNPNAYSTSTSDAFGNQVAVSNNYAIVAAVNEDDAGGTISGKVYIFDVTTGSLLHTLDNPNPYSTSESDAFGTAIAASGNYVIIGANQEDDAGGISSGKAYIFNITTGSLIHTLDNPNAHSTSSADQFGYAVDMFGKYAIVGAWQESDPGGSASGKAYIFDVINGTLLHTLDNPNAYSTSATDRFGWSVAISDSYAIVGAYHEDDAGGTISGKAYIFDVTTGSLLHTLDNPNAYSTSANDSFGTSVALSGKYALVGTSAEDDTSGASSGIVCIFDATTGSLSHTIKNPNAYNTGAGDTFGNKIAVYGNYAVIGARSEEDPTSAGGGSGKAYIFNIITGDLLHTLDNPNAYSTGYLDYFSTSVGISGNCIVIGASGESELVGTSSGKAYIFRPVAEECLLLDKVLDLIPNS